MKKGKAKTAKRKKGKVGRKQRPSKTKDEAPQPVVPWVDAVAADPEKE